MSKIFGLLVLLSVTGALAFPNQGDYGEYDYKYDAATDSDAKNYEDETIVEKELPKFAEQSQVITAKEGDTVQMSCKTERPTEDVLIFKKLATETQRESLIFAGDMKLVKESNFENIDSVFTLNGVTRDDSGPYVCLYQVDHKTELRFQLNVEYAPTVVAKKLENERVPKGSSVILECEASGLPKPKITWSRDHGKFPSGAETEEGFSLNLQNVDRHVEGTYTCTADNGIGVPASAAISFMVEYPPEITTEKAIIRTGEGDRVELVCLVHSRPAADVYWTKDGIAPSFDNEMSEIEGGHRHVITITDVKEEHFGAYECHARNTKGEDSAVIDLTDIPKEPSFISPEMSAEETSYILVFETESYYPVTEYMIKMRQSKANESTNLPGEWMEYSKVISDLKTVETNGLVQRMKHIFNKLTPATDYEAKVTVKNQLKWGKEGSFNFSTRKVSAITRSSLVNGETSAKETVGWHKTSSAGLMMTNFCLLIGTLTLAILS